MSENSTNKKEMGFLIDASRCIDCRACLVACSVENQVSNDVSRIWIKETGVTGQFPNLARFSAPYHCMHCDDPSCVSACTVGALQKSANGIVTYDIDRCIGCRYCMYACPFEVPNFEWDVQLPLIVKCDMCVARLSGGEAEPACAATCPTDAITFGEKSNMLAQAHQRIELNSERYVNHVYGETENGGTGTFYVSPVPFEELGFPTGGVVSPAYSNRLVTHGTPAVAGSVAIGLSGIYLTIKRHHHDGAADGEGGGETAVAATPTAALPEASAFGNKTTPRERG